ncbi:MAG: acyl-CoA dehydrogenase family protein [Robiginitomaculum sp.]|nr:acyl-CoA dehydrogenase family protein [Robiginitomaculum sp.]MDQ7077825.1 acyl-CoA dehydrogenase family protein [Robiginitomaculum sp.]
MSDQSFLDWPFFEDHHRVLAQELDVWAGRELPAIVDTKKAHEDVDQTCRALVAALGKGGWLRYCVPAEFGGVHEGLDVRSLCLIRETLARHSGLADFAFAMQGLGSGAISMFGNAMQKAAYLPAVAAGKKIAAFALTEPDAGSDAAAMSTQLIRHGDHYLANGQKTFISNGGIADFYTLFAKTDAGVSAIIVDADTKGLGVAERIEVIAPHPLARLTFKDCAIPAAHLLGEEGRGFKVALSTLDVFRTTVGAAALGFSRRALDEALGHARRRAMFGATLADLPLAQGMLAEMALDVDASALLIYRSAWTKDVNGIRVTREAAMAKLYATDQAQSVIDKAVQLLGGLGVTKGQKVEELYREVRALRIYEGASEVQKIVIARQLLQGN